MMQGQHAVCRLLCGGVVLGCLVAGSAGAQTFSVDLPTTALLPPFSGADDLFLPGLAPLLPGALGLPPGPGVPPPVDVDAFTFSQVALPGTAVISVDFSVAPGSIGTPGSAVSIESGGIGFVDEPADIFASAFGGTNVQVADGDGLPLGPPIPLILTEPGSNVDGWDATPPFGPPAFPGVYFSITPADAAGHPIYAGSGAAWIFFAPPVVGYSVTPALFATDVAIGLVPGDDIDGLAIVEDGSFSPTPGDSIYFSLAPGSPTLVGLGASPADILVTSIGGAPAVAFPAGSIGLLPTDDVDALDVVLIPEPTSMLLLALPAFALLRRRRA